MDGMIRVTQSHDLYTLGYCLRIYTINDDDFPMRFKNDEFSAHGKDAAKALRDIRVPVKIGDLELFAYPYEQARIIAKQYP